jgi:putative tricarboxylic transport membrane protein
MVAASPTKLSNEPVSPVARGADAQRIGLARAGFARSVIRARRREERLVRSSEFWGGVFWLALGAGVAWSGLQLGHGRLNEPGSGFMLIWLGLIMMGLAAGVTLKGAIAGGVPMRELWAGTRWGKVLVVIAVLLAYAFLFERLGFIPGALLLLLVLMFFIDPVSWLVAIPVSVLATLGVWAAMTKWLKIQLPAGLLAGWL